MKKDTRDFVILMFLVTLFPHLFTLPFLRDYSKPPTPYYFYFILIVNYAIWVFVNLASRIYLDSATSCLAKFLGGSIPLAIIPVPCTIIALTDSVNGVTFFFAKETPEFEVRKLI